MSAVPTFLAPDLAARWAPAFDRERKIARVLDELGGLAGRDVVLLDIDGGPIGDGLRDRGVAVNHVGPAADARIDAGDASAEAIVGAWSSFRGADAVELGEAERVLRPGGRLLAVHDYGRDDVDRLLGERPESTTWSRRGGPFTDAGFRIRVVHCFWTFDALDDATAFLDEVFGAPGVSLAAGLRRPRLAHNVAVYHRTAPDRPD